MRLEWHIARLQVLEVTLLLHLLLRQVLEPIHVEELEALDEGCGLIKVEAVVGSAQVVLEHTRLGDAQCDHGEELQAVRRELVVVAAEEVLVAREELPHLVEELTLRTLGEGLLLGTTTKADHEQF